MRRRPLPDMRLWANGDLTPYGMTLATLAAVAMVIAGLVFA